MKITIVYYSRTGYTERVVNELRQALVNEGFTIDVYKVLPVKEYSKPLHVNPRLIYDTLVRRGTSIRFGPTEPKLESYDYIIAASPIWIGTLSSPIQEFLKKYTATKPLIVITTSFQSVKPTRIASIVEKLCRAKPLLCINIRDLVIRDSAKLKEAIQDVVKKLKATTKRIDV